MPVTPVMFNVSTTLGGPPLSLSSAPEVGVYYTTLNQPDTSFALNISALLGRDAYNMEDILRSNGALHFKDVALAHMDQLNSSWCTPRYCNWMQSKSWLGYYGLYRKRAEEAAGVLPDFANISQTAAAHARMMTSAGISYSACL